jgi:DNA-binding winged helix-turn-helix (wHTH) protein
LLDTVWGHQHISESVLKTIISELRAALSDDAKQPRHIETASRRGYRFIAALSPWQAQALSTPRQRTAPRASTLSANRGAADDRAAGCTCSVARDGVPGLWHARENPPN